MEEKNKKTCKICGETFSSDKSLHIHIARKHKIILAEYRLALKKNNKYKLDREL